MEATSKWKVRRVQYRAITWLACNIKAILTGSSCLCLLSKKKKINDIQPLEWGIRKEIKEKCDEKLP